MASSCESKTRCSGTILLHSELCEVVESELELWLIKGGKTLSRTFTAKNFQAALDAITAVGSIAERVGHHPDLHLTSYRNVEIVLYTHTVGGVTQVDIELAKLIDAEVKILYSPKWLRDNPGAIGTAAV